MITKFSINKFDNHLYFFFTSKWPPKKRWVAVVFFFWILVSIVGIKIIMISPY